MISNTIQNTKFLTAILVFFIVATTYASSQSPIASITYTTLQDSIYVQVRNNTQDTIYLFDSYITDGIYSSYLRQYDKHTGCVLSLLPLWPYLSVNGNISDKIVLNDTRVIKKAQIPFHVTSINPNDTIVFHIHKAACWANKTYTVFIDLKTIGYSYIIATPGKSFSYKLLKTNQLFNTDFRGQIKFHKLCREQICDDITIKLAIFEENPEKYFVEGCGYAFPKDKSPYITIDCKIHKF